MHTPTSIMNALIGWGGSSSTSVPTWLSTSVTEQICQACVATTKEKPPSMDEPTDVTSRVSTTAKIDFGNLFAVAKRNSPGRSISLEITSSELEELLKFNQNSMAPLVMEIYTSDNGTIKWFLTMEGALE